MKRKLFILLVLCAVAGLTRVDRACANTADCMTTPGATDITDMSPPDGQPAEQPEPPEGVVLKVYAGTRGTTYTWTCTVDTEPAIIVGTGADVKSWSFDSATSQVTAVVDFVGFLDGVAEFGPVDPFGLALVWPSSDPASGSGPPAEFTGSYMSTNVFQWNLLPPEEDNPAFGFELSGPDGQKGFIHMFIPGPAIAMLSQLSGKTLAVADLAVFNDGKQATLDVSELNGGAYIDLNVLFDSTSTEVEEGGAAAASIGIKTVGKTLTVGGKKPLSLAAMSSSVKKGKKVQLYGWLGSGDANKKVTVQCRKPKSKKYLTIRVLKTKAGGAYSVSSKFNAVGTHTCMAVSGKLKSPKQTVKIRR